MSRLTIEVTFRDGRRASLSDNAISDAGATVYSHHVVYPNPTPIVAIEHNRHEDGKPSERSYSWIVEITADSWLAPIFERFADVADNYCVEFTAGVVNEGVVYSYEGGDRRWFAEQQALRGIA